MLGCRTTLKERRLDSTSLIADLCEFYDDLFVENKDNFTVIFEQIC